MKHSNKYIGFLGMALIFIFFTCDNVATRKTQEEIKPRERVHEKHRPQFHFTPKANWMNDPNGMFYHKGKYHLFYQYYPDSTVWGPMHWGHAESVDLVHWQHLPIALYPDSLGLIFSGGAVVDKQNTSKLGTMDNPPIVATFTHHNMAGEKAKTNEFQYQSLAYSTDGGISWLKYTNNPVIPNTEKIKDFRDPKVVWYEPQQKWVLVLAAYDRVKFYASENLIDWEFMSDFGIEGDRRLWECPDFIPMKVSGSTQEKWVLIVSIQKDAPNGGTATSYFVGEFDGEEFISDEKNQKWLDWGTDNYAFVTWNNIPKSDGRTIGIGWMSNWQYAQVVPTKKWRSAMTLPRELKLFKSDSSYILGSTPVKELKELRKDSVSFTPLVFVEEKVLEGSFAPAQSEIIMEVNLNETTANSFGIELTNGMNENLIISFDKTAGMLYVDRTNSSMNKFSDSFFNNVHSAPIDFNKENLFVHAYIDAASIEIFINDGELNFSDIFFPTEKFDRLSLFAKDGKCSIKSVDIYSLNSIWK